MAGTNLNATPEPRNNSLQGLSGLAEGRAAVVADLDTGRIKLVVSDGNDGGNAGTLLMGPPAARKFAEYLIRASYRVEVAAEEESNIDGADR